MQSKRIYAISIFLLAILLTGCLGPSRGYKPPSGGSAGIAGTVYFGLEGGLLAYNATVKIDGNEYVTNERGQFSATNTLTGNRTVEVITPVNTLGPVSMNINQNSVLNLVVPWPSEFHITAFEEFACLRGCIGTGGGISSGTVRWEHGKTIRYYIDTTTSKRDGKDVIPSSNHVEKINTALRYWIEYSGLKEMGILDYERVYDKDEADLIFEWGDVGDGKGDDAYYELFKYEGDVLSGIIRKVRVRINNLSYIMDAVMPYYQATAFALGGWYVKSYNNSIFFVPNSYIEGEFKYRLSRTPYAIDRNFILALYSLAPGTIAR